MAVSHTEDTSVIVWSCDVVVITRAQINGGYLAVSRNMVIRHYPRQQEEDYRHDGAFDIATADALSRCCRSYVSIAAPQQ